MTSADGRGIVARLPTRLAQTLHATNPKRRMPATTTNRVCCHPGASNTADQTHHLVPVCSDPATVQPSVNGLQQRRRLSPSTLCGVLRILFLAEEVGGSPHVRRNNLALFTPPLNSSPSPGYQALFIRNGCWIICAWEGHKLASLLHLFPSGHTSTYPG